MYTNPVSRYLRALKARIQFIPPQNRVQLGRRRIYIMPSRYGIWFTSTLLVMLFGAINYNNSLGYLLTFLLASLGLVSILYTYRNLAGLTVEVGKAQAVFVGEMADFKLLIDNQAQAARYALIGNLPLPPVSGKPLRRVRTPCRLMWQKTAAYWFLSKCWLKSVAIFP
jgi:hypothetical protein